MTNFEQIMKRATALRQAGLVAESIKYYEKALAESKISPLDYSAMTKRLIKHGYSPDKAVVEVAKAFSLTIGEIDRLYIEVKGG